MNFSESRQNRFPPPLLFNKAAIWGPIWHLFLNLDLYPPAQLCSDTSLCSGRSWWVLFCEGCGAYLCQISSVWWQFLARKSLNNKPYNLYKNPYFVQFKVISCLFSCPAAEGTVSAVLRGAPLFHHSSRGGMLLWETLLLAVQFWRRPILQLTIPLAATAYPPFRMTKVWYKWP